MCSLKSTGRILMSKKSNFIEVFLLNIKLAPIYKYKIDLIKSQKASSAGASGFNLKKVILNSMNCCNFTADFRLLL